MTVAEWVGLAVFVAACLAALAVVGWLALSVGAGLAEEEWGDE